MQNKNPIKSIRFSAFIHQHESMNAAYIEFPFSVMEVFGKKGHVKVKALFDHTATYRGSLANMGSGCHILIVTQEIRALINKSFGETVEVEIVEDVEPRLVTVPDDVKNAFIEMPDAALIFEKLSYSHKREYIMWIDSAKKSETRTTRIVKMLNRLLEKK